MAPSLADVMGLLYRADWTRLSLSADVRFETDRDLLYRRIREGSPAGYRDFRTNLRRGRRSEHAMLLIAPGGRYRLEQQDGDGLIEGNDGERGWGWWPGPPDPSVSECDLGDCPPVPELFGPSGLLGGYTLVHELRRRGGGLGVAAMCAGGGMGSAVVIEVPAP